MSASGAIPLGPNWASARPLMGWSGRTPVPCQRQAPSEKEHAKSEKHDGVITLIGIDIGKSSFHNVGLDRCGAIALRRK
jgi:hypothetical protein